MTRQPTGVLSIQAMLWGTIMRRASGERRALEILNAEPTEELLSNRLEEVTGDKALARLGPKLFAHRAEIGSFLETTDLEAVEGISESDIATLISGLNRPMYEFESETLELVHWVHGSALAIDRPEAFGAIERRKQGIRISSLRRTLDGSDPILPGWSWAHMSIPVPSFVGGKQFHVKSVLFSFSSSNAPFGVKGDPIATPYEIEVWDGHVRIAAEEMPYLSSMSNRYVRVPVESGPKLRWGLSVSFHLSVFPVHQEAGYSFWIDIGAVGVELVTRTGQVLQGDF